MTLPLDEFLRDPDAGRARLGPNGGELIVMTSVELEKMEDEIEEHRFVGSVLAASDRMRAGGGHSLEEVETELRAMYGF